MVHTASPIKLCIMRPKGFTRMDFLEMEVLEKCTKELCLAMDK